MHCSENLFLGTLHLDMPTAGSDSRFVKVRFTYDINGILEVEAVNHVGQKQRKVILNSHIRMSDKELEEKLCQLKKPELYFPGRRTGKSIFWHGRIGCTRNPWEDTGRLCKTTASGSALLWMGNPWQSFVRQKAG